MVEIIECDFRSAACAEILRRATIVFTFLLPKIMPLVTRLLVRSVPDECRVVSYIFDLARCKKEKQGETRTLRIDSWPYPSLGEIQTELGATGNVLLSHVHPDLRKLATQGDDSKQSESQPHGEYRLLSGNDKRVRETVASAYDLVQFRRFLHATLSDHHRLGKPLSLLIEYEAEPADLEMKDLEMVRPTQEVEVSRTFKNGSEMRSDLKLYQFPLKESDFGWKLSKPAYRIFHADK